MELPLASHGCLQNKYVEKRTSANSGAPWLRNFKLGCCICSKRAVLLTGATAAAAFTFAMTGFWKRGNVSSRYVDAYCLLILLRVVWVCFQCYSSFQNFRHLVHGPGNNLPLAIWLLFGIYLDLLFSAWLSKRNNLVQIINVVHPRI